MDCKDIQERLADALTTGALPHAVSSHLTHCATCAEVASEAQEGAAALRDLVGADDAPPVDVSAVLAAARRPSPSRLPRLLRGGLRAAAAVLVAVGVLALLETRVEAAEGELRISFALPGAAQSAPLETEPATDALADVRVAVRDEVLPVLADLSGALNVRDQRRVADIDALVTLLDDRRREDFRALAFQIADVRDGLLDTRRLLTGAVAGPPELPNIR